MALSRTDRSKFLSVLASRGMRATRQRELVYDLLVSRKDHPTADILLDRAKEFLPSISQATVYNCLESLAACGLIRYVRLNRQATRFCPQDDHSPEHAHFYCRKTGRVHDIHLTPDMRHAIQSVLPDGCNLEEVELNFRGIFEAE